ncbi:tetratricopeptide repeat protein [Terriglobus aquaticus]|uniref:Tetratricopeptide repeat protein n=1 Tax=Terriglobus aquaticus TaxID=940139 RepID=A0ABW9KGB0_9BACT|nr:tetratricopeptide repeat protein [Terriglobus aquaticus]
MKLSPHRILSAVSLVLFAAAPLVAQNSSSSNAEAAAQTAPVQRRGVEAAGSAVTLETSEQMFTVAAALNTCGYDAGLAESLPVRSAVRREIADQTANVDGGLPAQRALCGYIQSHQLPGSQNLAQFVSLALFLSPDLQLSFPENEMPPDALNVVNVLPLLRTWASTIHLHAIFVQHRADYEQAVLQVHDTVTRMLLETNAYLHQPATVYDGRRFLVLLEPMLSPEAANARIYGTDYFVVLSATRPQADAKTEAMRKAGLHLEELRHIYLLYEIDPIIYARASSTARLLPILKTVQDAPIDFLYKNDVNAFLTECLIKAIEARTMDTGIEKPSRKANGKERFDPTGYNIALQDYERRAEVVRRQQVIRDMRSGWVLTQYFYDKLSTQDREGISLKESMGELVYGMDVPAEASRDKKIPFFDENSPELVGVSGSGASTTRRGKAVKPQPLTAMDQAELKLQQGDRVGAADLAEKELAAHPDSTSAMYVMARIHLMQREPQEAFDTFEKIIATGKDTRTVAWSHVYLGRMYDTALAQPDRTKATAEYKAALAMPGIQPDVQAAAEQGLKQAFAVPQRAAHPAPAQPNDDDDIDAITRKQKESYQPNQEKKPQQ